MPKQKKLFDPQSDKPFELSRTAIELFCSCPRCFYLNKKCGVPLPQSAPYTLNSAVDHLLKVEFDSYAEKEIAHPLMTLHNINALPFTHEKLNEWRNNFKGIQFLHEPTNFLVFGAIDALWIKPDGTLIIVDFKATSKKEVNLESDWQISYKRQMEVYQWLFRKNGFQVDDTGYFVYCNALKDTAAFNGHLDFDLFLLPYKGKDKWIEPTLKKCRACLECDQIPEAHHSCQVCRYFQAATCAIGNQN